ncbi:SPOR domain-containing protein [Flammeovirga kamogawensis]|uniref:SPOR domain-containing protein n=1 Tax=Flammeovirga kamogawensis TaxID=373891 RepID=A0ABX8GTV6_9BACT|nr:hypothetical protein [Flammeovirga kamogawensis]MBB6459914.1 hypothetical protein [Flammeovirga kamogawensis]QWG07033.1 hypothetical protein KM029_17285 [Flammeovirga kamogawensis]TRX68854.1 hypothetical protein EO216_12270 [Flammeovirga kamogawensis]
MIIRNKILNLYLFNLIFIGLLFVSSTTSIAQEVTEGQTYSPAGLSQEPVNVKSELFPTSSDEVGDTTFTIYGDASVPFKIYFVNGAQYDNIFNPNPTGIILNGREFNFFCSMEKSIRQNYSNVLEAKEFDYLGKSYLMLISFREDCLGDNCRYRCYNVFDITDKQSIRQTSFSSLFQGTDSFGDFNNDGKLDFLRVAPKPPKDHIAGEVVTNYLITSYTMRRGIPRQLTDQGNTYYLYVKGTEDVSNFNVLQAYWFFNIKNKDGENAEPTTYFAEYISFDPMYRYLYNPNGVRIEKNRWSVLVTDVGDLESAQEHCHIVNEYNIEDVFIMIDQYSGDITYQVFAGNFVSRESAEAYLKQLQTYGVDGQLVDFLKSY